MRNLTTLNSLLTAAHLDSHCKMVIVPYLAYWNQVVGVNLSYI